MNKSLTVSTPGDLMSFLTKGRSAIELALPKHLNADRMMRLAVTCFSTNSQLRNCTAQSILASLVVSSQIGLEPGVAGQAYLIPYGTNCTLVPGWQGLVGLLNNSGRATAWTGAVFKGDLWDFQLGSAPRCIHIPGDNFGDPDMLEWVYACGKVNGSETAIIEAWPMSRVRKHRDRFNKVGDRHYSFQHPEMYARKVVLLQVLKYLPRSIELNNAIVAADAAEIGHMVRADEGVIIDIGESNEPVKKVVKPGPASKPAPEPPQSNEEPAATPSEDAPDKSWGPEPEKAPVAAEKKEPARSGAPPNARQALFKRLAIESIKVSEAEVALRKLKYIESDDEIDAMSDQQCHEIVENFASFSAQVRAARKEGK